MLSRGDSKADKDFLPEVARTPMPGIEIQVSEDYLTARINRIDHTTSGDGVLAALQPECDVFGEDIQGDFRYNATFRADANFIGIKKIVCLVKLRRDLEREIEDLLEAQCAVPREARIEVQGTLFSGVEPGIGEAQLRLKQGDRRVWAEVGRGEQGGDEINLRPLG